MRRDRPVGVNHRSTARLIFIPLLLWLLFAGPVVARAEIGVGTDIGRIALTDKVHTGGSFKLPVFKVINTGTEPTGYVLKSVPVDGYLSPGPSWFTFEPSAVYLEPSSSAVIHVTMDVPADAKPGEYKALLVGEVNRGPAQTSGARVNIGAGPRLEMTVVQGVWFRSLWYLMSTWFIGGMPWTGGILALLLVAAAASAWFMRRRAKRPEPVPQAEVVNPAVECGSASEWAASARATAPIDAPDRG